MIIYKDYKIKVKYNKENSNFVDSIEAYYKKFNKTDFISFKCYNIDRKYENVEINRMKTFIDKRNKNDIIIYSFNSCKNRINEYKDSSIVKYRNKILNIVEKALKNYKCGDYEDAIKNLNTIIKNFEGYKPDVKLFISCRNWIKELYK